MAKYAIFVCFFAGQTAKRQPSVGQTAQAKIYYAKTFFGGKLNG